MPLISDSPPKAPDPLAAPTQDPAAPPPEAADPVSPPSPDPAPAPVDPKPGDPSPVDSDDAIDPFDYLQDRTGLENLRDLSGGDVDKALKILGDGYRFVGRKDEDAAKFKALRERLGDDGLQRLLEPQSAGDNGKDFRFTKEQVEGWRAQIEAGSATQEVQDSYRRAHAAMTDAMVRLTTDRDSLLKEAIEPYLKEMKEIRETVQQTVSQTQRQTAVQSFFGQHNAELFVGGDPNGDLTPLGKKMEKLYVSDPDIKRLGDGSIERYRMAYRLATASQPKPSPGKPVNPNSVASPALSPSTGEIPTVRELVRAGKPLSVVEEMLKNGQARMQDEE